MSSGGRVLALLALAACGTCSAPGPDSVNASHDAHLSLRLQRLAFGSCSKAVWPQRLWGAIRAKSPQMWLWAGDAVYLGGDQPSSLEEAFNAQLQQEGYQQLLAQGTIVDGVYDDHDYGGNDAGKHLASRSDSQRLFLDFIGVARDAHRRDRQGAYWSYLLGGSAPGEQSVSVIILDTRFHRDSHVIPSLAAAAVRWLTVSLGVGAEYDGDVLGEEQWEWLEGQLSASQASVHIMVSSIQVLTSNPLVESWAHFPAAKRRLLELLLRTRPPNLIILSGDVHFAELSGNPPVELTSSGMTHTCGTTFWARACAPLIRAFNRHRRHPSSYVPGSSGGGSGTGSGEADAWEGAGEGFYTGYNFGFVDIDYTGKAFSDALPSVWASAIAVDGSERLRVEVQQDPSDTLRDALAAIDEQWLQGRSRRFTLLLYLLGAVLSLSLAFLMILQLRH